MWPSDVLPSGTFADKDSWETVTVGEGAPVNLAELAAMAWGQHAQPPDVQRASRCCQSHLLKRRSARLIPLLKPALASGAVTALSLSPEPAARPVLSSRHVAGKAQSHGQHSESSRATSRSFLRPARRPHVARTGPLQRSWSAPPPRQPGSLPHASLPASPEAPCRLATRPVDCGTLQPRSVAQPLAQKRHFT